MILGRQTGAWSCGVMFAGQWVNHPHNPGLYARNRYGAGIDTDIKNTGVGTIIVLDGLSIILAVLLSVPNYCPL